jgi:2-oxo-3-hexenedioate decarboxylase
MDDERMARIASHVAILDKAAREVRAVPQLTLRDPELTVPDAYRIQAEVTAERLRRGEKRIGMKMGLTSRAKMLQVGVNQMAWGRLTDAMLLEEGDNLSRAKFIHPRIEPEIAFLLKSPLAGKVSAAQALEAVAAVAPAMEIIDSRYENFRFALVDVIADNSSASALVIGQWNDPRQDLSNLGVALEIDGHVVEIGSTAAILGHPLRSLVAAARLVAEAGERIEAGHIVMAGGITAAPSLSSRMTVRNRVERLGSVTIHTGD